MRKSFLMVAMSALMLLFSCLVSQAQNKTVVDTEKAPTYEIGGQIFSFQSHDLGFGWGAGSRFTYNLNNHIAFDSEVNFFLPDEGPAYATQGLFGIKAGKRIRHFGIFAKVRPGFQTNLVFNDRARARLALDVGGVAEFYPNRHVVLRFDAGDVVPPRARFHQPPAVVLAARAPRLGRADLAAGLHDIASWVHAHHERPLSSPG